MKTRDKILETALNLFNEWGVPNVTLRKIAAAMFISQGNLNYHFKHREDIIEALYFQLFETFETEKARLENETIDLQFVLDAAKTGMEALFKYRFLMIDFNQNMRENPKLHKHFIQLEQMRKQTYLHAFNLAIQSGVMRAPAFETEYEGLNERIRVFSDFWIASAAVYHEPPEQTVAKYHNLLVEMFFPYFTRESQREFLLKRL
ncbi:TetR/AcrR family transcriptional regulator [Fluviicola sp.]|uniref:TetR/AcrR family transcriptional regulator n=1 Tax=Fluviicola sp. TaxID=1917219 RepID=UPI0031D51A54